MPRARDVGFTLTYGTGLGSPEPTDIANTDCLVLIGSHLGENMHNTQVQEFAQAVEQGASIIVVDPRFSVAASKAKYWLPIKPGTDMALLLAWMNVLVSEGLYDKEFVAKHGHGFDKFAAAIKATRRNGPKARPASTPPRSARPRASSRALAPRPSCTPAGASTGTATTRSASARSRSSTRCWATGAARAGSSCPRA